MSLAQALKQRSWKEGQLEKIEHDVSKVYENHTRLCELLVEKGVITFEEALEVNNLNAWDVSKVED